MYFGPIRVLFVALCSFCKGQQRSWETWQNFENRRKPKLDQHKKHAANEVLGCLEAALSSPCNTLLRPCCKNLNCKEKKKKEKINIICTYSAVTVHTDRWPPCWQGRATWQQGEVSARPHHAGSRGKVGQRQGAGGWWSFPAPTPQCQTSVHHINELEVQTGWVCGCLFYRDGAQHVNLALRRKGDGDTEELGLPCFACAVQTRRRGRGGGQSRLTTHEQQN